MKKLLLLLLLLVCATAASFGQGFSIAITNDTSTGTQAKKPCKLNVTAGAPSVVLATAATDLGVIGICGDGAGTTGKVNVQTFGIVQKCTFTNATTGGDYVQVAAGGGCFDAGSTRPTSGVILGTVFQAGGSAGDYSVSLNKDIYPTSSGATTWPITLGSGASVTNSTTEFIGFAAFNATESLGPTEVPRAGTISGLYCHTSVALSGVMTWALTVRTGAAANAPTMADTALTCTLNSTNTQTCSDLTHSFSLAAGDFIDVKTVPANSPTTGTIHCSMLLQ